MVRNKIKRWVLNHKTELIIGFIFGALIAPSLATLGLIIPAFESLRPLLIGPMDLIGTLIPNIQTGPDTYYVPIYKWTLAIGFNGICYAILGGIIQSVKRKWAGSSDR